MNSARRTVLSLSVIAVLGYASTLSFNTGCGGSSDSTTSGGDTPCFDYSSYNGMSPAASFKTDVLPIFQRSCSISATCHGDANGMSAGHVFLAPPMGVATKTQITTIIMGINNVPAVLEPDMVVVKPGDPKNSFMTYKVDADPPNKVCSSLACNGMGGLACGTSMPQAGTKMSEGDRDAIRRWIAQGAQDN